VARDDLLAQLDDLLDLLFREGHEILVARLGRPRRGPLLTISMPMLLEFSSEAPFQ
jgi:hypothetical protein